MLLKARLIPSAISLERLVIISSIVLGVTIKFSSNKDGMPATVGTPIAITGTPKAS